MKLKSYTIQGVCTLVIIFIGVIKCEISKPNIIFIIADDMGWNDVGFTGRSDLQTPNLDALAYHGRILSQHYALPTCTPSRAALFTGKYATRTGMQGWPLTPAEPRGLPLDQKLLPEYFKDLGYQTHLLGKWHLGYHEWKYTPTSRGFDSHFGYLNGFIGYYGHTMDVRNMSGHDFWRNNEPQFQLRGRYVTDLLTEETERLVHTLTPEAPPLFLMLSHLAPHTGNADSLHEYPKEDIARFNYIPDLRRRKYAAMVWNLDKSVGRVVKSLADKNVLNNTIIVFISDNGAQTVGKFYANDGSNFPLKGLKFTLLEGGVRTSAVIWTPNLQVEPKGVSHQMFHISDWLPTLYQAAGGDLKNLGGMDGVSQWPAISGPKSNIVEEENNRDSAYNPRQEMLLNIDEELGVQAVRYRQWKLIKGAFMNGAYDGYYGNYTVSGFVYNLAEVNKSLVNRALSSLGSQPLSKDEALEIRSVATIDCKPLIHVNLQGAPLPRDIPCDLVNQPVCLFDVLADPCERSNLATVLPNVVQKLEAKLETYLQQMKPQINEPDDYLADPELYNGTWIPWRETSFTDKFLPGLASPAVSLNINTIIMFTSLFLLSLQSNIFIIVS